MMRFDSASIAERPSEREVIFTRLLDAPRELVWRMWSDIQHLSAWYGPTGFTMTTHTFAFAPGGEWRLIMHGPNGVDYPNRIVFREIDPPARIVYENRWDLPDAPLDFVVEVTLSDDGTDMTSLSIHMTFADETAFQTAVERYGVLDGGTQTLDRIAEYLHTLPSK